MNAHQRLEEPPVIWHPHVQELMSDHEVLESMVFVNEIARQGDDAFRRAGTPLVPHLLNANHAWIHAELDRPRQRTSLEILRGIE